MPTNSAAQQDAAASSRLYRAMWRWHFYAGLYVIPFLLMLAVTGFFMMLFLLFLRFLPCINIAEVKWTKVESDPHHDDTLAHPDHGAENLPAYQHELVSAHGNAATAK